MKKFVALFAFLAIQILASNSPAMAAIGSFDKLFTVDSFGSTTEKSSFSPSDPAPFLYYLLPFSGAHIVFSLWNKDLDIYTTDSGIQSGNEGWLSLSNWDTVKESGQWKVNAAYLDNNTVEVGSGSYNFTVTPEPVSSALFLVGGLALAGAKKFRSRSKNLAAAVKI